MSPLKKLFQEYKEQCKIRDSVSVRFYFDSDKERFIFILRLSEINAEYYCCSHNGVFIVEVFN